MPGFRVYLQQNLTWGGGSDNTGVPTSSSTRAPSLGNTSKAWLVFVSEKWCYCSNHNKAFLIIELTQIGPPGYGAMKHYDYERRGMMQSRGGKKKGEKKSRGRVGRWRQIQVWVRIPWIVLFMSASLFNENQKDFSWGNIQQNGVRNEWAEGGEKKFVIFIFIFFMSTVWACCRQALKNWADRFLWEKKDKKVPLVMCAAARFLKLAWTAADVLINYESIQRPRIFLFLKKIRVSCQNLSPR